MKWFAASLVTALCLAGCHAPKPSLNLLAPYGSTCVPPPSTNPQPATGTYYNRTAPPTTSVPSVPAVPGRGGSSGFPTTQTVAPGTTSVLAGADDSWKPVRTRAAADPAPSLADAARERVSPASYDGQPAKDGAKTAAASTARDARRPSSLRLNGMAVTDATGRAKLPEPARFVPAKDPIEISQLPPAKSATTEAGTVVASSKASDRIVSSAAGDSAAKATLRWRSRAADN